MKFPDLRWAMRIVAFAILLAVCSPFSAQAQVFRSGFEPNAALDNPTQCFGTGCWQFITGTDSSTGYTWPPSIWGGSTTAIQLLADTPVDATTIRDYMFNQILTITGHNGTPTQALYSQITQSGCCGGDPQGEGSTQNSLQIQPASEPNGTAGDLYISYWLKFQPGLAKLMGVDLGSQAGPWNWRLFFEWKTDGDYRVSAQVKRDPYINNGNLFWVVTGDNVANGNLPPKEFWNVTNTTVPVPVGEWLKFEVFWHRSAGPDGRVWMAVNGLVIADRFGRNMATSDPSDPDGPPYAFSDSPRAINRILASALYSSTSYPIHQWMDDLYIDGGFPLVCLDLPCAPH